MTTLHLERFAPDARALVVAAQDSADERKHALVEPIHLLSRAIDRDRGVAEVFRKAGANPTDVAAEAETTLSRLQKTQSGKAYLSEAMQSLLARAEKEASGGTVQVEHLLNALSQEIRGNAAIVLQAFGLGPGSLRPHMAALRSVPRDAAPAGGGAGSAESGLEDLVERARKDGFDPVIGRDVELRRLMQVLERRQKNHPLLVGDPGVGKSAIVGALAMRIAAADVATSLAKIAILRLEVGALLAGAKLRGEVEERIKRVLADVKRRDAVLYVPGMEALLGQGPVGSGVGELLKPALERGEVRLLATTTPDGLRKMTERDGGFIRSFTVMTVQAPSPEQAIEMLRGVTPRYESYHRVKIGDPAIVSAVRLAKRYVQDRALPDSALDLLDEAAGRKRVELEGIPAAIDESIRRLASLKAPRQALADDTDDMSVASRERMDKEMATLEPLVIEMRAKLDSRRGALAAEAALRTEFEKVKTQIEEARQKQEFARLGELEHVVLPDLKRRLDVADAAVHKEGSPLGNNVVGAEDVAVVLGEWTGIPVAKMLESEADKLLKMEERLSHRIVGQAEAVRAVSRAVRRGRVGLRDPGKPIGSFLFLGPSGVGKTELAKTLAEFLFDDEQAMTRLDMSEFMEKHMAQRLVGSPPGYADSEQGGFLTEAVRRRPYSVLLFDEVEKAHTDVFNLLLQVLDDGRLTDGRGRTADFSNTVVIMTSNIGSQRILETDPKMFESEEGRDALRDVLREELKKFLRPEFLNRIDDVVVFRPLSKTDLRGIVDIQLKKLVRLLADRELSLDLTEKAKLQLVELGYEPVFGARPLRRAIVRCIQDPLAETILQKGYAAKSTVKVDFVGEEFTFSAAATPALP